MKAMPTLFVSGFTLGVSLFTPISSFNLGIDFYEQKFPKQQIAVKVTACYEVAFVVLQLCCHFCDSKLPISRAARIELRHLVVAVLMSLMIIWEKLIVGPPGLDPPSYAAGLLLGLVTAVGCFDGLAVGAIFGEMAVLGPGAAHALVAGTAGVMPLLASLRIIFKAALPPTEAGLRLSIVIYLATSVLVLLTGLTLYIIVILPAVAAVNLGKVEDAELAEELGVVPLIPTISFISSSMSPQQQPHTHQQSDAVHDGKSTLAAEEMQVVDDTDDVKKSSRVRDGNWRPFSASKLDDLQLKHRPSTPHHHLQYTLSLPSSIRGTPLLARRLQTNLDPSLITIGSLAGACRVISKSNMLESWASSPWRRSPGVPQSSHQPAANGTCSSGGMGPLHQQHEQQAAAAAAGAVDSSGHEAVKRAGSNAAVDHGRQRSNHPADLSSSIIVEVDSEDKCTAAEGIRANDSNSNSSSKQSSGGGKQTIRASGAKLGSEADCQAPVAVSRAEVSYTSPFLHAARLQARPASKAVVGSAISSPELPKGGWLQVPRGRAVTAPPHTLTQDSQHATDTAIKEYEGVKYSSCSGSRLEGFRREGGLRQPSGYGSGTAVSLQLLRKASRQGCTVALLQEMISQKQEAAELLQPRYFDQGMSVWKRNWLAVRDNWSFMLGTALTYACNYGIFPGFISFIASSALGSWYSLLLVTTYGIGDLTGKLMPLWRPQKPQVTVMSLALARLAVFFTVYAVALLFDAGPEVFFPATFVLSLTGWYEAMIFSIACDGHHPLDAYQIESLLAIWLDVGIAVGSCLSLAWAVGPWAYKNVAASAYGHGH